ncbi:hypothetical protein TSAR_006685 [Trichomalopsis sarcophagae]|uniref:Peptidoglycan-recognition protein n=1 Tax=Trichomalopsis sarcophagae TaxID=543379 RepID=A0A232EPL5_9HYME|nr:hypothetical protein TSAR_006685 [Trichomalopsis sarcophagae]
MTLIWASSKIYLVAALCFSLFNFLNADCPNIIERSQWGAKRWKEVNYLVTPLLYVIIHHTATPECNSFSSCADIVKNIQKYHMNDLKWFDIGHSFMIGGDGNVYEGTGWSMEGAHTYGYNKKSISIAFIGNYQHSYRNSTVAINIEKIPTEASLTAARDLIKCGKSQGYLRQNVKVIGARQVTSTLSPGDQLYARVQTWPEWTAIAQ